MDSDILVLFRDIVTAHIYIGESTDEMEMEIESNMWRISVTQEQADALTKEDLLEFIGQVLANRRQQILRAGKGHGMIFYMWFDEQACQLRFNLISDLHHQLPFRARLQLLDTPDRMIADFLESRYHDGIPLAEAREVPTEEWEEVDEAEQERLSQFVLPVFRTTLSSQLTEDRSQSGAQEI